MSKSPVVIATSASDLKPEPIPPDWILEGAPKGRSKILVRSQDWLMSIVLWECTAGRFNWHYGSDELLIVIAGDAYLLTEGGEERRFGPGDMCYFPAGFSANWRVPDSIRKIALVREDTLRPLGLCLKALNKILRMIGLKGKSALMFAFAVSALWSSR